MEYIQNITVRVTIYKHDNLSLLILHTYPILERFDTVDSVSIWMLAALDVYQEPGKRRAFRHPLARYMCMDR